MICSLIRSRHLIKHPRPHHPHAVFQSFAVAALLLLAGAPAGAQQDQKIVVKTADDLPRHTYHIDQKPSEFILSDKPFTEFVAKVKADAQADLAKYQIEDPTTL